MYVYICIYMYMCKYVCIHIHIHPRPHRSSHIRSCMKKESNQNLSGSEPNHTNSLTLLVKNMLCSRLARKV